MKKCVMMVMLMPVMAFATTWYVDGTNGSDGYSGKSQSAAKKTIQAAIDVSMDGDKILVAAGTYDPIAADNKAIIIRSMGGKDEAIISGGNKSRCAKLGLNYGDYETILDGFTITSGRTNKDPGSGVRFGTLKNCHIIGCTNTFGFIDSYGGGAFGSRAIDCVFENNWATQGGGIALCMADRCVFKGNYAEDDGGAVSMGSKVHDSLIVRNESNNCAGRESGAACAHGSILVNCTIVGNHAKSGGVIADGCTLTNCIVTGNTCGTGKIVYDEESSVLVNCFTEGNPCFVDASSGDYHLAGMSPCVDAGDNSCGVSKCDLDGSGRIVNGTVDIGCYEYGSVGGPYVEKVGDVDWTYMIKNGRASVGDGVSAAVSNVVAGSVGVPTTLRERPVVAIDDKAFVDCTNMTSVTIPASVKTIGDSAFEGCGSLADVYFEGYTLSSIGKNAFSGCCWDLIMHVPTEWQGRGRTLCGYSVWKAGSSDEEKSVSMTVTNVVVQYVLNSVQPEIAVPVSGSTGFVAVITEVKSSGAVSVPIEWKQNYPQFETKFGTDFGKALMKKSGKRDGSGNEMFVWQDYVAGTDPTDLNSLFAASITMIGDQPRISYTPELTEEQKSLRTYTIKGKKSLTDAKDWETVAEGHEADYNFFKVVVEMK